MCVAGYWLLSGRMLALALVVLLAVPVTAGMSQEAPEAKPVEEIRRELIGWRKTLDSQDDAGAPARKAAAERIAAVNDPRAVPALGELWEKEKVANPPNTHRQYFVQALMNIGDRKAFLRLVEISVEDPDTELRKRAASWIGGQDNRDDAIPLYVRYLRSAKLFHNALNSLGYTQITKKGTGPPSPELVAALIDNLITVTPVRKRASRVYDTGWYRNVPGYGREQRTVQGWITEYQRSENKEVKQLLYDYTFQDLGYDQAKWRKEVLNPLKAKSELLGKFRTVELLKLNGGVEPRKRLG